MVSQFDVLLLFARLRDWLAFSLAASVFSEELVRLHVDCLFLAEHVSFFFQLIAISPGKSARSPPLASSATTRARTSPFAQHTSSPLADICGMRSWLQTSSAGARVLVFVPRFCLIVRVLSFVYLQSHTGDHPNHVHRSVHRVYHCRSRFPILVCIACGRDIHVTNNVLLGTAWAPPHRPCMWSTLRAT